MALEDQALFLVELLQVLVGHLLLRHQAQPLSLLRVVFLAMEWQEMEAQRHPPQGQVALQTQTPAAHQALLEPETVEGQPPLLLPAAEEVAGFLLLQLDLLVGLAHLHSQEFLPLEEAPQRQEMAATQPRQLHALRHHC